MGGVGTQRERERYGAGTQRERERDRYGLGTVAERPSCHAGVVELVGDGSGGDGGGGGGGEEERLAGGLKFSETQGNLAGRGREQCGGKDGVREFGACEEGQEETEGRADREWEWERQRETERERETERAEEASKRERLHHGKLHACLNLNSPRRRVEKPSGLGGSKEISQWRAGSEARWGERRGGIVGDRQTRDTKYPYFEPVCVPK